MRIYPKKTRGTTLVEIIIFISLFSVMMTSIIQFLYAIQLSNTRLLDRINTEQRGFIATVTVILITTGILAFMIVTASSAAAYADSVEREVLRIQHSLNLKACQDTLKLLRAKDYFMTSKVVLIDLGCEVGN